MSAWSLLKSCTIRTELFTPTTNARSSLLVTTACMNFVAAACSKEIRWVTELLVSMIRPSRNGNWDSLRKPRIVRGGRLSSLTTMSDSVRLVTHFPWSVAANSSATSSLAERKVRPVEFPADFFNPEPELVGPADSRDAVVTHSAQLGAGCAGAD